MLESLAPLVRVGGTLVYAVCSLEPEETDAVVDAFLASHGDFEEAELPEWARGFARGRRVELDPARGTGDGFFAVKMRKALARNVVVV